MKPIYNTTKESPYLVTDYPYGRLRCQIRFWVEFSPNKGFRLVSQTQNPKNNQWNTPKQGTYHKLAGCLYLDDHEHVKMAACSEYSSASDVMEYIHNFPEDNISLDILKTWVLAKVAYYHKLVSGQMRMVVSMNGVEQAEVGGEADRNKASLKSWEQVLEKF